MVIPQIIDLIPALLRKAALIWLQHVHIFQRLKILVTPDRINAQQHF